MQQRQGKAVLQSESLKNGVTGPSARVFRACVCYLRSCLPFSSFGPVSDVDMRTAVVASFQWDPTVRHSTRAPHSSSFDPCTPQFDIPLCTPQSRYRVDSGWCDLRHCRPRQGFVSSKHRPLYQRSALDSCLLSACSPLAAFLTED